MTTNPSSGIGYEMRLMYEPLADLLSARLEEADAHLVPFDDRLVLHLDRRDLGSLVGFHINDFDSYDLSDNRAALVEILGEEIVDAIQAMSVAVRHRLASVALPPTFSEEAVRQYENEATVSQRVELHHTDLFGLLRQAPERSRRLQAVRAFLEDLGADLDLAGAEEDRAGVVRIPLRDPGEVLIAAAMAWREGAREVRETAQELALTLFTIRPRPVVAFGRQQPHPSPRYGLTELEEGTEPIVLELGVEGGALYFEGRLADLPSGTPVTVQFQFSRETREYLQTPLEDDEVPEIVQRSTNLDEQGGFIVKIGMWEGGPDAPLDRVIEWFDVAVGAGTTIADRPPSVDLSSREQLLLELLAAGRTNRESAARMGISVRTLENHINNIMRKLGAVERQELIDLAVEMGYVSRAGPD